LNAKKAKDSRKAAAPRAIAFEDAALVNRTRNGDMQAFGSLVAKYQDRVFNLVYRMTHRREDAEELAQEAFLKALEKISQFRGHSQFYTWLFRIAANLVISHRRRGGRIRFQSLSGADELGDSQAEVLTAKAAERRNPNPRTAAMANETQARVMQALEELDDEMRIVVILRDMEGMDYTQIAEVLGVPAGTVKSRLHRARTVLRETLVDLVG
jgi:RNA polymerase sigma-70 factor (ECF subfamily)